MTTTTVGRLNVFLNADLSGLERGLRRAERSMGRLGRNLSRNVTAPIAALGAAAVAAGVRVGNMADELLDLEQQTGLTTDQLQEFRRVATIAGVAQDTVAEAAIRMTTRLRAAGEESLETRQALDALGLSVRRADGSLRSMDELLPEIVSTLQGVEDITNRNSLAVALFGRSAANLAPVLGLTADQMEAAREEAHELGMVLDREALEAANQFRREWQTVRDSLSAATNQIGVALIPVLSKVAGTIQDRVIPTIQSMVRWVSEIDTRTIVLAASVWGLVAAVGPLVLVGAKLAGVLALIASPAGVAVTAIASLSAWAVILVRNWDVARLRMSLIWSTIQQAVFSAVDSILGVLERLAGWIPGVGDRIQALRRDFDEFATGALGRTGERILQLEQAVAQNFTPTIQRASDVVREFGDFALPTLADGAEVAAESIDRVAEALDRKANRMQVIGTMSELLGDGFDHLRAEASALTTVMEALASEGIGATDERMQAFAARLREVQDELAGTVEEAEEVPEVGRTMRDALVDAAERSTVAIRSVGSAIRRFVAEALRDLARLEAVKGAFGFLGPLAGAGAGLAAGVVGGLFGGFFADGGFLGPGKWGVVGERGPELIQAGASGATIAPMAAGSRGPSGKDILVALGPPPRVMSPEAAAVTDYYRRLIDAALPDHDDRGGRGR